MDGLRYTGRWRDRSSLRCRQGGVNGVFLDGGDEAVAAAVQGLNHVLLSSTIPHRAARRHHPAGQRGFTDQAAGPDLFDELVFGHDPMTMLNQIGQHIEDLGLDLDHMAAAAQLIAL